MPNITGNFLSFPTVYIDVKKMCFDYLNSQIFHIHSISVAGFGSLLDDSFRKPSATMLYNALQKQSNLQVKKSKTEVHEKKNKVAKACSHDLNT